MDLDSRLGKSTVVTKNDPSCAAGGYYCEACDCVVKDSINYLDHINGKKHQRNLGMSMKVERSSLDQVKARFQKVKERKLEAEAAEAKYNLESRVRDADEERRKYAEYKKENKKRKKASKAASTTEFEMDPDMAAVMGFSGFASTSKKN